MAASKSRVACSVVVPYHIGMQVARQELDKVRSCKSNLNKMMARVLELKQVTYLSDNLYVNGLTD